MEISNTSQIVVKYCGKAFQDSYKSHCSRIYLHESYGELSSLIVDVTKVLDRLR